MYCAGNRTEVGVGANANSAAVPFFQRCWKKMSVTVAELPSYRDKEIKRIREDLNLTQRNFAFVLGVSQKTVEAWESGRNMPQGIARRFLQMLQFGGKKFLRDFNIISVKV